MDSQDMAASIQRVEHQDLQTGYAWVWTRLAIITSSPWYCRAAHLWESPAAGRLCTSAPLLWNWSMMKSYQALHWLAQNTKHITRRDAANAGIIKDLNIVNRELESLTAYTSSLYLTWPFFSGYLIALYIHTTLLHSLHWHVWATDGRKLQVNVLFLNYEETRTVWISSLWPLE